MRKAPLYVLILVVGVIIAILGYFIYLNVVNQPEGRTNLGLLCTVVFLVIAFIAIELLFKPHLILRPREDEEEEEEQKEE